MARVRVVVGRVGLAVLVVLGAAGCGGPAAEDQAVGTARSFVQAIADNDGVQACGLLTEKARQATESFGRDCSQQIVRLDSDLGAVQRVEVWGDTAQVAFAGDTLFLAHFSDGWHIRAAGCQPQAEGPYQCEVEG